MTFPIASPDGRIDLNTLALATLGRPVFAEYDYTNPVLAAEYNANIQVLFNVYNKGVTYSSPSATTPDPIPANRLTQADADAVSQALANLVDLAKNGAVLSNTDNSVKKYFLTTSMVTNLDMLLRSFMAVGADHPTQAITLNQLNVWKDLSIQSPIIQGTMQVAVQQLDQNHSIQAMIELQYVKTGSDLIQQKLSSLNDALSLTNGILRTLGNVQTTHNNLVVYGRGTIPFNYNSPPGGSGSAGDYRSEYTSAASTQFGQPIFPVVPSTLIVYGTKTINTINGPVIGTDYNNPLGLTAAGVSTFNGLLRLRQSIVNEIHLVSAQSSSAELSDPQSMYNKLKVVKSDLSTLFARLTISNPTVPIAADSTFTGQQKASALVRWILDNYNQSSGGASSSAGLAQQNITLAITSAQSLNDTQKEDVRNFLFVFQEYYQSASSLLQAISKIIEKMAQGIAQ